jgi:hypothetical protein
VAIRGVGMKVEVWEEWKDIGVLEQVNIWKGPQFNSLLGVEDYVVTYFAAVGTGVWQGTSVADVDVQL